jgi:hypothetical protein
LKKGNKIMGLDARILFTVPTPSPTPEQLLIWGWEISATLGAEKFWRNETTNCMSVVDQNYYDELPDGAIDIAVGTRYYSIGYERGDLLFLVSIAEWVERNIPGATVHYGSDSGPVSPWTATARAELLEHFYSKEGRAYFEYNSRTGEADSFGGMPRCARCVPGHKARQNGWGGKFASFYCPGCKVSKETHDGGITWEERK